MNDRSKNKPVQTGPRTLRGKQRSRFNALKDGATAKSPLLPFEDAQAHQMHKEEIRLTLNPRNYVETLIVDDYAHWLWLLQRRENCNIHRRERHLSNLTPAIMADMLGLNQKMQRWAPDFMVDLNESFSDRELEHVKLVEDELSKARLGHKEGLSLDELYDKYETFFWELKMILDEQRQPNVFGPDGKVSPHWHANEDSFWEWVEVLGMIMHFIHIFRSKKSEIRVHMERWYFTADIEAINLSSPDPVCMKYQNHAFSLLDRLAKYREDFGGDSTLVETGK
jgi:hypothetical protein